MDPAHYPDPLGEALSFSSQRVAQVASLVGAMAQIALQRKALADAKNDARDDLRAARTLADQERLLRQSTRLGWAPAHDAQWLANADLLQTARAWGSAVCYADTDPTAASAMRKCEARLRTLHPYAMARYDRLREDGMNALDAMGETAPLFGRASHVRVGDPAAPRQGLNAGTGSDVDLSAAREPGSPEEPGVAVADQSEQRGRQIIERLQESARTANRHEPRSDELASILEATTNLPYEVIESLTRQAAAEAQVRNEQLRAADAEWARADDLDIDLVATPATSERAAMRAGAQRDGRGADAVVARAPTGRSAPELAAESFPHSATIVVRTATPVRERNEGKAAAPRSAPNIGKRPSQST
jgi:hypothetical protein